MKIWVINDNEIQEVEVLEDSEEAYDEYHRTINTSSVDIFYDEKAAIDALLDRAEILNRQAEAMITECRVHAGLPVE